MLAMFSLKKSRPPSCWIFGFCTFITGFAGATTGVVVFVVVVFKLFCVPQEIIKKLKDIIDNELRI